MEGVFSRKNVITYLVLGIMALAIPLSVKLIQTKLVFSPKAAGEEVTCPDSQLDGQTCLTKTQSIDLLLDSPYGGPAPSVSPSPGQ